MVLEQLVCKLVRHRIRRLIVRSDLFSKCSLLVKVLTFAIMLFRGTNTIKSMTSQTCYCKELGFVQE